MSLREVFPLSTVARKMIHEDITRLLSERKAVAVVDPTGVLGWKSRSPNREAPQRVKDGVQVRELIGDVGCNAVVQDDGW